VNGSASGGGFGMEDALSYMFGGGDAAWMIRDGCVMSAAAGVMMTKDVSSDSRMKNNACEVAIIVICFGGQSSNMSLI
jgi:hypothetical protein